MSVLLQGMFCFDDFSIKIGFSKVTASERSVFVCEPVLSCNPLSEFMTPGNNVNKNKGQNKATITKNKIKRRPANVDNFG